MALSGAGESLVGKHPACLFPLKFDCKMSWMNNDLTQSMFIRKTSLHGLNHSNDLKVKSHQRLLL